MIKTLDFLNNYYKDLQYGYYTINAPVATFSL